VAGESPAAVIVDADGNQVGVLLDGTVYRLQTIGKVVDSSGVQVDPAAEGTLASLNASTVDAITEQTVILRQMFLQLRKMNFYLSQVTDVDADDAMFTEESS